MDSCRWLEQRGYKVTYLPVQHNGLIDLNELDKAITPDTSLVSVMGVNNEIGVCQDLKSIGAICKKHNVFFHTDCAQLVGKLPVNVDECHIDLMSMSGHKVYGPKGVGMSLFCGWEGCRCAVCPPKASCSSGSFDVWRWPGAWLA